jgi:hypothetical protein
MLRERQIKEWKRDWKINLIERDNPRWIGSLPEHLALIVRIRLQAPAFAGMTTLV